MSEETKRATPHGDKLRSLMNVDEGQYRDEPSETVNEPIPNTPFRLVGDKQTGYWLMVYKYRVTDVYKTVTEATEKAWKRPDWEMIEKVCGAIAEWQAAEAIQDLERRAAADIHQMMKETKPNNQ